MSSDQQVKLLLGVREALPRVNVTMPVKKMKDGALRFFSIMCHVTFIDIVDVIDVTKMNGSMQHAITAVFGEPSSAAATLLVELLSLLPLSVTEYVSQAILDSPYQGGKEDDHNVHSQIYIYILGQICMKVCFYSQYNFSDMVL